MQNHDDLNPRKSYHCYEIWNRRQTWRTRIQVAPLGPCFLWLYDSKIQYVPRLRCIKRKEQAEDTFMFDPKHHPLWLIFMPPDILDFHWTNSTAVHPQTCLLILIIQRQTRVTEEKCTFYDQQSTMVKSDPTKPEFKKKTAVGRRVRSQGGRSVPRKSSGLKRF